MQLICVSRGSFSAGKELAEKLAKKLGYPSIGREQLIEEATRAGIQVGKLETAMIKPHLFTERLAREKDHFRAFMTRALCERALQGDLVYHGRTGHLLLQGVENIFRVRVIADMEFRIQSAMRRLNLDWEKSRKYIESVHEDRARWVRELYGVHWDEAVHYDVIVNTSQMNVDNASSAMCAMAQLPEFQLAPASRRALEDLLLAAQVRVALAQAPATAQLDVKVRSHQGNVTITYLPQQRKSPDEIGQVARTVAGIRQLTCTPASTNLLWIEEQYSPESDSFRQVVEIASKWGSAVELLRVVSQAEDAAEEPPGGAVGRVEARASVLAPPGTPAYNGGIEDDLPDPGPAEEDGGLSATTMELTRVGIAGGSRVIRGGQEKILAALDRTIPYSLIVVGPLFRAKGHAAQTRMTRELSSSLEEQLKAPAVSPQDLQQYLFGPRELIKLAACLGASALLFWLVMANQESILRFLTPEAVPAKVLSASVLAVFVSLFAYLYGTASGLLLKLFKFE
ncbi:MAG: cytidylate kinase family protein [bacterium]